MSGVVREVGTGAPVSVRDTREIALVDLLDRLLAGGVVITGDITISIANVDLVRVSLRALITSVREDTALPLFPGVPISAREEERSG